MGAVKLEARAVRKNPRQTIDRLFADAFGPWPLLFRRTSWCGWRPIYWPPLSSSTDILECSDFDSTQNLGAANRGVKIKETRQTLTVEVTLPKILKGSLCIEISNHILKVSSERIKNASEKTLATPAGRQVNSFQRLIRLPTELHLGAMRARLIGNVVKIEISRGTLPSILDHET